jgi:hypothetical protein
MPAATTSTTAWPADGSAGRHFDDLASTELAEPPVSPGVGRAAALAYGLLLDGCRLVMALTMLTRESEQPSNQGSVA